MKISDDPLARPHVGNLKTIWVQKMFFVLNFTRILLFFWDLEFMLFDIAKDAVFAEILVFSNIFGFPVINWAPKWTKTLRAFHLSQNSKFWRIFQMPFLSNWKLSQVKISKRSNNILVCEGPKNPKRGHGCWIDSTNL